MCKLFIKLRNTKIYLHLDPNLKIQLQIQIHSTQKIIHAYEYE